MSTLTADIGFADAFLPLSAALPAGTSAVQIDNEQIALMAVSEGVTGDISPLVTRGINGTGRSAHSSGATVTPIFVSTSQVAPAGGTTTLQTITSATPSTLRLTRSELTLTPATSLAVASNGSLAGIRGAVTLTSGKSITAGYLYGTQGKVIGDGATIDVGSDHVAGIYGQLSLAGATVTSGHVAIIVASGQSLPSSANVDGIYLESGGNAINSMFKAICNADFVFDLAKESGADTWLAGTAGSSASKFLVVKVQGTTYKIELLANS